MRRCNYDLADIIAGISMLLFSISGATALFSLSYLVLTQGCN